MARAFRWCQLAGLRERKQRLEERRGLERGAEELDRMSIVGPSFQNRCGVFAAIVIVSPALISRRSPASSNTKAPLRSSAPLFWRG